MSRIVSRIVWSTALGFLLLGGAIACGGDTEGDGGGGSGGDATGGTGGAGGAGGLGGTGGPDGTGGTDDTPSGDFVGEKDTDFGSFGLKTLELQTHGLLQSHLVPGGVLIIANGVDREADRQVLRFDLEGTPDAAYNANAAASLAAARPASSQFTGDLGVGAVDQEGRVLLVAKSLLGFGTSRFLIRLQANGELDPSFGVEGVLTLPGSFGGELSIQNVIVLPDGKLVLNAIVRAASNDFRWTIVRMDEDGGIDPSFNETGVLELETFESVRPQNVRKLIVPGPDGTLFVTERQEGAESDVHTLIAKVAKDGTLDTAFGEDGFVTIPGADHRIIEALGFDDEGRILAVGQGAPVEGGGIGDPASGFITRYLADGTLDSSFGTAGIVRVSVNHHLLQTAGWGEFLNGVWFNGNRIVVGGIVRAKTASGDRTNAFAVALQFDENGAVLVPAEDKLGRLSEYGFGMARREEVDVVRAGFVFPTPDGKVLAIGHQARSIYPKTLVFGRWR